MKVGDKYLSIVEKFIFSGCSIRHMNMTEEQKLRTMIVYEAYQIWITDKQIRPMDICRRISARIYADMLMRAEKDPAYKELCEKLKIRPGVPRDYSRLSNDVQTLDHIVGRFNAPTVNIERAKVVDASDWLIEEGKKSGSERSVSKGAELKMKLNKDFDENEQGYDNMANMDVNITGDVSVIKFDRQNYTEEEKSSFAKRIGIPEKEVEELIENAEGMYETAVMDSDDEEAPDLFIYAEEHGRD